MPKRQKGSKLAVYLKKNFDDDLLEIHISTGIGYSKLSKGINDQLSLSLEDFYKIALRVAPDEINEVADEIFSDMYADFQNTDIDITGFSKFGEFISKHLLSKGDISNISGISVPILTNLMKENSEINSKLTAGNFYILCKKLDRDFATSIKFLYPDTQLLGETEKGNLRSNFYKNNPAK